MKKILPIALIIICTLGTVNAQKITRELVKSVKVIPENFGKANTTLVCIIRKHDGGKWIKKHIKKLYKGEYIFLEVKGDDYLEDDDFINLSDKNKYRFFIDCLINEDLKYGTFIYIEDRKTDNRNPFMSQKSSANKIIECVVLELNEKVSEK